MTGLLRDLMDERADDARVPSLDLDAIIQAGDQRVRRRRVVTGVGVGAVAAAVAFAAVAFAPDVVDKLGDKREPVKKPPGQVSPFLEGRPTYALGSTIYFGGDAIDVGPKSITSFVQTDFGFVFTNPQNQVTATNGDVLREIGTTGDSAYPERLVSDGPYAAWIDFSVARPELVVYDTVAGNEALRTAEDSTADGQTDDFTRTAVIAVDGGTVYWHNTTGVVATDLDSGDSETLAPNASADYLFDVKNGVFAMSTEEGPAVSVNTDLMASTPQDPFVAGSTGTLSPDGGTVATEGGDQVLVFDVASLDDVTPPHGEDNDIVFGNWIDDNTFAELFDSDPTDGEDAYSLRTCDVSTGNCLVSASGIAPVAKVLRPDGVVKG